MTDIATAPPPRWSALCEERALTFHSRDWQELLEHGFGARSLYFWDDHEEDGAAFTLFRAGPFRIAYAGFPLGATLCGTASVERLASALRQADRQLRPAALRIPFSGFNDGPRPNLPFVTTPETAIIELPSWRLEQLSSNMQRDIRQSQQSGLVLTDAADPADGATLYALYRQTVQRHQGALRYTEAYFRELIALAFHQQNVRVVVARLDGAIAGFAVFVRHGSMACYLHGASDRELRKYQPAALLIHEGITWAQSEGCRVFNLMASPTGQESLVRYKERWGGETREHRTYTLPTSAAYPLYRMAEGVYRLLGR